MKLLSLHLAVKYGDRGRIDHAFGKAHLARRCYERGERSDVRAWIDRGRKSNTDVQLQALAADQAVTAARGQLASLRRQFASLDRNRDGFLNRYELGRGPAPNTVTYNWHWKL